MARVEIVAVGSELLGTSRLDTNSLWLTGQLEDLGHEVTAKAVIGDHRQRLVAAYQQALQAADIVISTGGLGPTEDDLTRDAAAQALGLPLEHREELWVDIQERFARMGRSVPANNRRQALAIQGATSLPNPNGTAPGQMWQGDGKTLVLLPGPPRELKPMFSNHVQSQLSTGLTARVRRLLKVIGLGESAMEERIAHLYATQPEVEVTTLFTPLDLEIHLIGSHERLTNIEALQTSIAQALAEHIYADTETSLAEVVGRRLVEANATLATAESLSGGMLSERVTAVAGSSRYFQGGWVTYSEQQKQRQLGISADLLQEYSAVSEPVARAMAEAAQRQAGADYALALTGYAGPDGGTEADPVGTVYVGLATPKGSQVRRLRLLGDREQVRSRACQAALDWLRLSIEIAT